MNHQYRIIKTVENSAERVYITIQVKKDRKGYYPEHMMSFSAFVYPPSWFSRVILRETFEKRCLHALKNVTKQANEYIAKRVEVDEVVNKLKGENPK
jgi:hypothetical protein